MLTINNLGITYYMQSKFDLAMKQYIEVIKINPNDANAHENLAITYKQTRNDWRIKFLLQKELFTWQSKCL